MKFHFQWFQATTNCSNFFFFLNWMMMMMIVVVMKMTWPPTTATEGRASQREEKALLSAPPQSPSTVQALWIRFTNTIKLSIVAILLPQQQQQLHQEDADLQLLLLQQPFCSFYCGFGKPQILGHELLNRKKKQRRRRKRKRVLRRRNRRGNKRARVLFFFLKKIYFCAFLDKEEEVTYADRWERGVTIE